MLSLVARLTLVLICLDILEYHEICGNLWCRSTVSHRLAAWRRPFEDPGLRTAVEVPMFGSVSATRQN